MPFYSKCRLQNFVKLVFKKSARLRCQYNVFVYMKCTGLNCKQFGPKGRGGKLGLIFAGYVPLAFHSPYPIIVYFLANYRPHLSHFLENVIFVIPT